MKQGSIEIVEDLLSQCGWLCFWTLLQKTWFFYSFPR